MATLADVPNILAIQEPGALAGLSHIFPQEHHPFPREEIADRWRVEIEDTQTFVYVGTDRAARIVGFAARRDDQLMHFGTAIETWGSGLATELHDALVETFPADLESWRLFVFLENHRARRLYEKLGWHATDVTKTTTFPPHPTLVQYLRGRH